ncbi:hypothetical protein DV515_00012629 [Chloebia gouldiae]|uniref:Uncharacterized protein n=1 Tax=Chloebia gouldiae TaxID=44316 RepID=A0A3L8S3T8_CHLGU|nr:hypothetical protein DV515_00012629 [Chloebia gouldiae]
MLGEPSSRDTSAHFTLPRSDPVETSPLLMAKLERGHCPFKTAIASNQSSASSAFPSRGERGGDSSLLVSPLLVAGVVIGLVLLLSCATIVGQPGRPGRCG